MSLDRQARETVRQRAGLACQYCGVSETDVGGELTIDHFQPTTKGGSDDLENLLYCCARCNQHKLDYWPSGPGDLLLWNPLREPFSKHFLELDDGTLQPLTATGTWTLERLRLNRPPLVDHRLRRSRQRAREQVLRRYGELNVMLESLIEQQADMMEVLRQLLDEQQQLLRLLLGPVDDL